MAGGSGRGGRQPASGHRRRSASDGRSEQRLQLVVDAMTLWFEAGHEAEGEKRLADALAAAGPAAPARAIGLTYWAWLRGTRNRPEAAAAAAEAVSLARRDGDAPVEAFALQTLGDTLDDTGPSEEASKAVFGAADRSEGPPSGTARPRRTPSAAGPRTTWPRLAVPVGADRAVLAAGGAAPGRARGRPTDHRGQRGPTGRRPSAGGRHRGGPEPARPVARTGVAAGHRPVGGHRHLRGGPARAPRREAGTTPSSTSAGLRSASVGRPLHTVLGAAALADLYTASGRAAEAHQTLDLAERMVGASPTRRSWPGCTSAGPASTGSTASGRGPGGRTARRRRADADADALPPERVIWLLESAEHAVEGRRPDRVGGPPGRAGGRERRHRRPAAALGAAVARPRRG